MDFIRKEIEKIQDFDHIFVQDSESASLLKSINVSNASKSGDTRFDRVYAIAQQSIELPLIRHFKADRFLIVAGSTWPQDEDLLSKFITEAHSKICLIVAPHEIHQSNIKRIHKIFPGSPVLYSNANINNNAHERVMIINNIGLLSSVYKYADIAYVGGAFKTGLHNILEPACFSLPVVFGPEYSKFREASEMIGLDIAISIRNYSELKGKLNSLMSNKEILREKSNNAGNYIKSKVGATLMIIDKTYDILIKTK